MTVFGVVWIAIILWCFTRGNLKYMLLITLLFMTFQSDNVIIFGGKGIGPGILTSIAFIAFCLIRNKFVIPVYRENPLTIISLISLILLILYSSYINGILKANVMYVLQFVCYVLCFLFMLSFSDEIGKKDLYSIIRNIIIFHCIFGFVQILTSSDILPIRQLLNILFYNDASTDVVFHKTHYTRVMSTFMEPSYFSGFAVGAFYYLLSIKGEWRRNKYIFLALIIEIILTQSSTAYAAFCITGLVFICVSKEVNLQTKIGFIMLGIFAAFVLYFGFYGLLDSVIFSKLSTGSGLTRQRWNKESFELFMTSPMYGVGYKNCRGSSIFYSLLGQLGLFGLILYVLLNIGVLSMLKGNHYKFDNVNATDYFAGLIYAVITAMVCQLIACPDIDLCTYWFWLYCAASCRDHILNMHSGEVILE